MTHSKLYISDICQVFNEHEDNEVQALKNVNLKFNCGDFILIIGHNGSGKSTLLNIIDGRLKPTSGNIFIDGENIIHLKPYQRSKKIYRLFQETLTGLIPHATIRENLAFAKKRNKSYSSFRPLLKKKDETLFKNTLEKFNTNLSANLDKKIFDLSPGERQAVVLALLLIQTDTEPQILLADEPTASLDPEMAQKTIQVFRELAAKGWLCIVVTHDTEFINNHKGRIVRLKNGEVEPPIFEVQKNWDELYKKHIDGTSSPLPWV